MIGRLRGTIAAKQPPQVLVDVGGVGYEVEAPMSTFYQLPPTGEAVTLHTHLVVRDDAHLLFGFATERERTLFRSLIKVNGVGAKLALTILSGVSTDEFVRCVQGDDAASLTRLPGVGKKTAERLLVEMRDRLKDFDASPALPVAGGAVAPAGADEATRDAVGALVALGYKPAEAGRLVNAVAAEGMDSEALIRAALRQAVRK